MAKYMIHLIPEREWYVNKYLVPSMLKQGIKNEDIYLWNDEQHLGNLTSFVESMKVCGDYKCDGVWHLQDDVMISHRFKEFTEKLDNEGVVCGICYKKQTDPLPNLRVDKDKMWWSFQCIRIPTSVAKGFADWYFSYAGKTTVYKEYTAENKFDDTMFWIYLQDFNKEIKTVYNAVPNLVNHIDYLIGGSSLGYNRDFILEAHFWDDEEDIKALEKLKEDLKSS